MNAIDRITYCLSLPFTRSKAEELDEYVCCLEATGHCPLLKMKRHKIKALSIPIAALSRNDPSYCLYIAQLLLSDDPKYDGFKIVPQPYDGVGSSVPSLQLHPVFGIDTERVPPNDAMSHFVGFGDKSWDNLKNFFQTQGFEFLFLSQSARRVAFGCSMAPKTPVLKLNRPFARKPPAAIASELTRVACAPFAKPQVAGLRHS